jgi:hypothetical protein
MGSSEQRTWLSTAPHTSTVMTRTVGTAAYQHLMLPWHAKAAAEATAVALPRVMTVLPHALVAVWSCHAVPKKPSTASVCVAGTSNSLRP